MQGMLRRAWWSAWVLVIAGVAASQQVYEVGPEDVLHIVVLGQPELSGDFSVDRDGVLNFPILGKLKAAGMAPEELERKLTTLLSEGYLKKPQVSLSVREYRSHRVFVTGEVSKPGPVPLKGDQSLRSLLGELGNLGAEAGHEVVVVRPPKGSAEPDQPAALPTGDAASGDGSGADVFRFNVKDVLSGAPDQNMILLSGDTIHFPRAAMVYIMGQVSRPGPYRLQEETVVLQALAVAGGITERGSNKRIKIIRIVNGKKVEVKAQLTDVVQPGDTIMVGERFF
jgi:polysaccharide export outer membrane protein